MWKLALGFIIFAALALFILSKGGDIDISGEKHGIDAHPPAAASAADLGAAPAPAASVAAPSTASSK
ncbi:MAG: hypothetical protein WCT47_03770 [Betaproteobacteria bacterium]|jgi:hypothetical protein